MKPTAPKSGGGGFFPYPKYVWSPAGGWWGNTKHWRRNSGFAVVAIGVLSATIFAKGASIEVSSFRTSFVSIFSPALSEHTNVRLALSRRSSLRVQSVLFLFSTT